jgi:hypothetical protein
MPLSGNGRNRHARNNRTVESGVFCAGRAEAIQRGAAAIREESLDTAVRRGRGWCEMAASLQVSCGTVAGQ